MVFPDHNRILITPMLTLPRYSPGFHGWNRVFVPVQVVSLAETGSAQTASPGAKRLSIARTA